MSELSEMTTFILAIEPFVPRSSNLIHSLLGKTLQPSLSDSERNGRMCVSCRTMLHNRN